MDRQRCRLAIFAVMALGALASAGTANAQPTYTLRYAVDTTA
jgi:hypothetical protein